MGVDPQPFFRRLYNPTRHMERYDPDGEYVRRHVPELREVPGEYLTEPWTMPADVQRRAGCVIGADYPEPIVDHAEARRAAIERYRRMSDSVPAGPAHVAVVSFLAARAAPAGGFWIALAGGVALARVAERRGARLGFGASLAAMLETVAIIGPARLGIPLTQAATAPLLGRLEARGWRPVPQIIACALIRLLHNTATTAFFIWVITGGLDAYAGTYDAIGRRLGLEIGSADALALTLAGLLAWAAFASTVQVLVYRRGLASWDSLAGDEPNIEHQIGANIRLTGTSALGGSIRGRSPWPPGSPSCCCWRARAGRSSPP